MEYRNPKHNGRGGIDCEINHPAYGWIPFTASPDDPETWGRALHEAILESGTSAPYEPAPIETRRAGAFLPPEEFLIRASDLGLITKDTAEEASDGTWPAEFAALVRGLSPDERIRAKAKWARSQNVRRNDPLLDKVAKTKIPEKADRDAALDQLFGIV